ncbi:carbohydrate ABC transporter substrate-binding protein [Photobacterium galatheae]|uniref:ABC transporter substrate-binding protein n=1 Tax=Photobacterium galatheae TaxID=1654360 RepID=UPI00202CFF3D|nr:ABC transporter substrate-binding protein [Photobacterium galatheae]MCM0148706.1 carbohydrate ABC transporter substrate-binding protein [Photobacterium galatheae]
MIKKSPVGTVRKLTLSFTAALVVSCLSPAVLSAETDTGGEVEVLHWWTAKGEMNAADVLQHSLEQQGIGWKNFAIAGGGGESAMTVLKSRAVSGNPPSAAQLKGDDLQEWGMLGFLTNLNKVADAEHWDQLLPPVISRIMKYQGHYVAVPVNIHRVNWLWVNPNLMQQAGATVPDSLDAFFVAAEKLKAAGIVPVALGSDPWQEVTLFESIALAVLGPVDYRRAFVELDMSQLGGDKMVEVFRRFIAMRQYIDVKTKAMEWSDASAMVVHGEAAMQFMGDWAKGELTAMGKLPGQDILCIPAPGTQGYFTYNIDSFAFFKNNSAKHLKAQEMMAHTILTPDFQRQFNLAKGSIPVRHDVSLAGFDPCSRASAEAFKNSEVHNTLVPSLSQGLATSSYVQAAIFDVVTDFFHSKNADPEQAAHRLARAVKSAR